MTARPPETDRGLTVASDATGWGVWHDASGLAAVKGLRLKRFALEARSDLLGTGVDFTGTARAVQTARRRWADVYYRWAIRASANNLDPETFEYYSSYIRVGQQVPSAAKAAELRAIQGVTVS